MLSRGPYGTRTNEAGPRTLGDRLKVLRIRSLRTQAHVAEELHTDQAQVSAWERDRFRPSKAILAALAAHYRIALDVLETGEGFLDFLREAPGETATEDSVPVLPAHPGQGGILAMDCAGSEYRSVEIMEAMQFLMESHRAGRKIWLAVQ